MAGPKKEYEVVSLQVISDTHVQVGLAPAGRTAQHSSMAVDPAHRGIVGADTYVEWELADAPKLGAKVTTTYSKA